MGSTETGALDTGTKVAHVTEAHVVPDDKTKKAVRDARNALVDHFKSINTGLTLFGGLILAIMLMVQGVANGAPTTSRMGLLTVALLATMSAMGTVYWARTKVEDTLDAIDTR
ncbi:hypothetical protein KBB27_00590 [Patescibacteria group bacterium]|nr:hypothetical protein [Patescibacteria group bacterium]